MGRKPSGKRGAIRLYLAAGMMAVLGLFLSTSAGAQKSEDAAGQRHLIDCLGDGMSPRDALACVKHLSDGSGVDTGMAPSIEALLEQLIENRAKLDQLSQQNRRLEAALDEKRQIISILIEQISRLKEVDIDIEKRRRNLEQ